MRKIELFTTDGRKIGEFGSIKALKEILPQLPANIDVSPIRNEFKKDRHGSFANRE